VAIGAVRLAGVVGPAALVIGRPDALLLGAALALVRRDLGSHWTSATAVRWARLAVIAGSAALIVIASWDRADDLFSIGFTVAAVSAAALIYGLVVLGGSGPSRVFEWKPAVAFGRVSYGFYLWHLPVLRWTDDRLPGEPALVRIGLGVSLALAATLVSYRVLEQPALRLKRRFEPPVATVPTPHETVPTNPKVRR
jgi:peptidoglycan/LPS O-acetylase OafA/YrhL